MFLAPICNPYHNEKKMDISGNSLENGVPVYLDGFAYSGIMNIQTKSNGWPTTASAAEGDVPFLK
jgi:hypothetical protein